MMILQDQPLLDHHLLPRKKELESENRGQGNQECQRALVVAEHFEHALTEGEFTQIRERVFAASDVEATSDPLALQWMGETAYRRVTFAFIVNCPDMDRYLVFCS